MSTNFHTAVVTGAAANAATINSPLGQLDAAMTAVDDRVDTIIASSGTSSTEVVDARGAGYTVLSDRLNDAAHRSNVRLVDPAFANNASLKRHATIAQAMAAASAGDTILLAPGIYSENVTASQEYLKIIGSGVPYYDSGTGRLVGGTIIRGRLDLAARRGVVVRDLGIDLFGVNDVDGIVSANTTPVDVYQVIENVFLLGNGYAAQSHGILASGGNHLMLRNIKVRSFFHGMALRCSFANVDSVESYACTGNTIIVKSETPSGDAMHVNISNVTINGNAADAYQRGGPIRVQSANDGNFTLWVNIANVTAQNVGEACIMVERALETTYRGTVGNVQVINVTSYNGGDGASRADFDVAGGTDITFVNCHSLSRNAGYGFRVRATDNAARVRVFASSSAAGGAGRYTGVFDRLELDSLGLITTNVGTGLVNATDVLPIQQAVDFTGQINSIVGTPVEVARFVYTGAAGGYSGMLVDLLITCNSGDHLSFDRWRIACERKGVSTLEAAAAQDGTRLQSGAGAHGTVTVTVNTGTANTLIVYMTGVSYTAGVSYAARVLLASGAAGLWTFASKA